MAEPSAEVPLQFEDLEQQREAVTLGMWVFLATEVLLFGGVFLAYFVYRASYPEVFTAASQQLHVTLGTINTVVLLTSSLTMALADHAARSRQRGTLIRFLWLTLVLGVIFLGIKAIEYTLEFREGLAPFPGLPFHFEGGATEQARLFFGLYFVMTGLHALHLCIGLGIVGAMIFLAKRARNEYRLERRITMTGLYWHFVDVVWVFLFPVLYLINR